MIPVDTIDKLEQTWRSITEFCSTLTEAEWKTMTQLPMWTVQDNLSHIIGTESSMHGLPRPQHTATDKSHVKNPIGDMNEDDVDVRRARTGAEVLEEWKNLMEMRIQVFRTADDAYFDQEMMNPTGPGTLADFLHVRVLDSWAHEQDMRRAVNKPGNQGGPAAEHTIDRLIRTIPIVVGKRAGTPEGGCVVIRITGAVQRTVATTVVNGRAQIGTEVPANALCDISMDSDTFAQLAMGRAGAEELATLISISGDAELAHRVVSQFNMMI
ncbi:MAG: maleylpyruvate isomerase family mycothiol-dependent enzyme [Ilumatobacteraceae bacterium]